MTRRILLTAPQSGAGKTTVTLGILRALARRGVAVQPAKSGPDYIDPGFHAVAAGRASLTLDAWAMPPERLRVLTQGRSPLVVEGAMGFLDGAGLHGTGSAADLARATGCDYVLVIDCAKMAHSVAAVVRGIQASAPDLRCAGVILNKVGSDRHLAMLSHALSDCGAPVLGHLPRRADFQLPERHLGLVLAEEISSLNSWLDSVADAVDEHIDLSCFEGSPDQTAQVPPTPPPAQTIAVAQDRAFAFAYAHILDGWRAAGAEIIPFSPLQDDAVPDCDFVFLPGGYPELHAGTLAGAARFKASLAHHAATKPVYGECGGYMVLGDGLVDADGQRHAMAGLLRLETSFAQRKLHLGYRSLTPLGGHFDGPRKAHEFHYASTLSAKGPPLFHGADADDTPLPDLGLQAGRVYGSFAHIIDGL